MSRYATPAVLLVGAGVLGWLRFTGTSFNVTPLAVGVVALAAAAVSRPPRAWTSGIVLVAWGIAVLLVRDGPLPSREASVFMVAIAVGALVAAQVAGSKRQDEVLRGVALTMLGGGVLFYLAFDLAWLRDWWVFAGGLAAAGFVEVGRVRGR